MKEKYFVSNDENGSACTSVVTKKKVAIIGAGFAGLTLANYLHHNHHHHCQQEEDETKKIRQSSIQYECLVLESKDEPISIVGTFRLPLHLSTDVLEPIRQMRHRQRNDEKTMDLPPMTMDDSSKKWLVSRPQLLTWLRTGIPIQYSARVEGVRKIIPPPSKNNDGGNGCYFLTIRSSSDGEPSKEVGPFDMVVVASGFSPNNSNGSNSSSNEWKWESRTALVVGDAKCSRHAWWDIFGLTRIQKGGAMAMMDAMRLAKRIIVVEHEHEDLLKEYSPSWQRRKRQQRKRLLQFSLLLIVLMLFLVRASLFGTQKLDDGSEL